MYEERSTAMGRGRGRGGRGRGRSITCKLCDRFMGWENESHRGTLEVSKGVIGPAYPDYKNPCACEKPTPIPRMTFPQFVDKYVRKEKKEWHLQAVSRSWYERQFDVPSEIDSDETIEKGLLLYKKELGAKLDPPVLTEYFPPATPLWTVCPKYHVVRRNVEFCPRCGEKNPKYKTDSDFLVGHFRIRD